MSSAVSFLVFYCLVRAYYQMELLTKDPFLEAALFMPLRTLQVRYLDDKPQGLRTFRMTHNNSFVINLANDTKRLARFQSTNRMPIVRRFEASAWAGDANVEKHYPFLRRSAQRRQYGDAGSTLSHIRLMEHLVAQNDEDAFVFGFEDDIRILKPLKSSLQVQAPADADVVFLGKPATKTVRVPWFENATAVRVIQGYGAFGYVVTTRGARIILRWMTQDERSPFDVVLTGAAPSLRVYRSYPDWPLVVHMGVPSSRRRENIDSK